jgi:hypothetical protein
VQLNAITVLEGLLPLLPPASMQLQVAGIRLGAQGREAASRFAGTLLNPGSHAPALPQHRNRLAGLLLQVSPLLSPISWPGVSPWGCGGGHTRNRIW